MQMRAFYPSLLSSIDLLKYVLTLNDILLYEKKKRKDGSSEDLLRYYNRFREVSHLELDAPLLKSSKHQRQRSHILVELEDVSRKIGKHRHKVNWILALAKEV